MRTGYVTLFDWDWKPIGQVSMDLGRVERNGDIDRSDLDDAAQKAVRPLLEGQDFKDVHVFIHEGGPATPEELQEIARLEYTTNGPDVISRDRNRRIRKPGPIGGASLRKFELK